MRIWTILMMLSLAVLAGCADEVAETVDDSDDASPMDDEGSDGNVTANATNAAPSIAFEADTLNGTAPLLVNFTLDGTDADGDNLTWQVDFDGDDVADLEGDSLPASFNHTFDAGNHTINATISDGQNATSASLEVTVTEAAAETDPDAPVDMGWYIFDPVTKLCHVKEYDAYGGTVYVSSLGGGTWVLAETNDVDGLQISNNHPAPDGGFDPGAPECEDGDTIVV